MMISRRAGRVHHVPEDGGEGTTDEENGQNNGFAKERDQWEGGESMVYIGRSGFESRAVSGDIEG
jgi:hypothetical protein